MQQGIDATVLPAMPQQKASPVQTGQFGQQVGASGPVAVPVQAVPVPVPVPVQAARFPAALVTDILNSNVARFRAAIGAVTDLSELQALYTAEQAGKGRSSVLSDLSQRIGKLAPVAAAVPVPVAAVPAAVPADLAATIAAAVQAAMKAEREATLARAQALR